MGGREAADPAEDANTRERLIAAAIEELADRAYPFLDGVQITRAAHRAGVPERTARRHFKSDALRRAVVEKLCDPDYEHAAAFGPSDFRDLERVVSDRSLNFAETIESDCRSAP